MRPNNTWYADKAIRILKGAKKELKRRGLNKGDFFADATAGEPIPSDGPCCVLGACMVAGGQDTVSMLPLTLTSVDRYLSTAIPDKAVALGDADITTYNDRPTTNRTHLYALIDRAIKLAKKDVK